MLSQGLGPVTDPALLEKMGEVLPRIGVIALREARVGVPLLHSLGVAEDKIVVTGDDAIEPAYIARKTHLGDKMGVGLRIARYSSIEPEDARRLGSILRADAGRRGTGLQPIPIDWRDEPDSDIQSLHMLLGHEAADVTWPDDDTPLSVIRQVGQCRVVVTSSYHAGVFSLAQGIPVVALVRSRYYADKFLGLADQFGCGCEVLALDAIDFERHLSSAIDYAWQSAPLLRPKLLAAAERQIACSHEAYARLRSLVPCN
jgi:polysaccharide pyruvyl transferase WcaK-like protein